MTKITKIAVVSLCIVSVAACDYVMGRTITVKVVDQQGTPVPGAQVSMGFLGHPGTGDGKEATNEEGNASRRGKDSLGVRVTVRKTGYYKSEKRIQGDESVQETILLREKKDPIPMYVKEVSLFVPEIAKKYGFDLSEGELVGPYGGGKSADIFLTLGGAREGPVKRESRLKVEFKGEKGGLIPLKEKYRYSDYKFPYKAPQKGYEREIDLFFNRNGGEVETNRDTSKLGYAIRVAGEDKENNEDEEFYHGKIVDYFRFSPGKNERKESEGYIGFTYYLNPNPNDRNIEFDPQRNLFKDAEKAYPP